ncbi:MAG TPA: EfeM/EfeO family lipoprotein [Kofleriaceae bacterium]|jgi:iron uptake system component EfeO|nr:EfeM/EfeO family lipoprotein [Kofleriaceae bacterium]
MNTIATLAALAALAACGDSGKTDAEFKADVVAGMHDSIGSQLADLAQAAKDLQAAAPTHAWNATTDAAAITAMRDAWKRTRVAYEHVEGATAPIFGDLDVSMDARYDDFLATLGPGGDPDLFDDMGVTGMHAIERILYAQDIRTEVIAFESPLPGYVAAAYPATDPQAMEFKTKLLQKLVDDAASLHDQWTPAAIDLDFAFQGLVGLMNEQKEKVNLAATGEEESRYANITLFDLRNNLDGTRTAYTLFQPWIKSHSMGASIDAMIEARFDQLSTLYDSVTGDALPPVPGDWSADQPTAANLATPFGMVWQTVHQDVDPTMSGSVVFEMNQVATMLGFHTFTE